MHKESPAKIWRKFNNRYKISGVICKKCKKAYYPPVEYCLECGSTSFTQIAFEKSGKLISWSLLYSVQEGFEDSVPNIVAIVELEGGEKITCQLIDVEEKNLKYGLKIVPTFRRIYVAGKDGIIHYGIKFTKS